MSKQKSEPPPTVLGAMLDRAKRGETSVYESFIRASWKNTPMVATFMVRITIGPGRKDLHAAKDIKTED